MKNLPVSLIRILPVFISVVVAFAVHRFIPGGPMIRLPITIALVLVIIWVFSQLTRRADQRPE